MRAATQRGPPGRVLYCAFEIVTDTSIEIPNRAAFKASEVCEIAQIPPYVLRSWEREFPGLGAAARPGGPRIYRRTDIEQILRIKQLVFTEGLTLAGARRRIEGEPPADDVLESPPALVTAELQTGVADARRDLRALLDLLSAPVAIAQVDHAQPEPPVRTPESEEPAGADDVPTWPPTEPRKASPRGHASSGEHEGVLPLGDEEVDPAHRARASRRTSREPHGSQPSKVE